MNEQFTRLLKLADELCDSVDAGEADIGGCRPARTILGELGPAVEACKSALSALKVADPAEGGAETLLDEIRTELMALLKGKTLMENNQWTDWGNVAHLCDRISNGVRSPRPADVSVPDDTGWLIERGSNEGHSPHVWLKESDKYRAGEWTTTAADALRFTSKRAAGDFATLCGLQLPYAITEHQFLAAPALLATSSATDSPSPGASGEGA